MKAHCRQRLKGNSFLPHFLLISLLQHSSITAHEAPQGGFYKREHSLVKPYSPAGGAIPFFDLTGDTMVTNNYVRLTPDMRSRAGGIWNKVPLYQPSWEVQLTFKTHGNSRNLAADGMAFWYVKNRLGSGNAFGAPSKFSGLGVFIDTYKNGDNNNAFPLVYGMVNDDTEEYDQNDDGGSTSKLTGNCYSAVRNRDFDTALSIKYDYSNKHLKVSVDVDNSGTWRTCFEKKNVVLPGGYYVGVTSATGDLTDNHDVIALRTYQLETNPEVRANPEWTKEVPRFEIKPGESAGFEDDHRNQAKAGGGSKMFWFLMIIGLSICCLVGYAVFTKRQEQQRKRFY